MQSVCAASSCYYYSAPVYFCGPGSGQIGRGHIVMAPFVVIRTRLFLNDSILKRKLLYERVEGADVEIKLFVIR
jgi:hypothetical protein